MNELLIKAELALEEEALKNSPEGTTTKAIIHQWLHAICYGNQLFAESSGVKKEDVLKILKSEKLYKNKKGFRSDLQQELKLFPNKKPSFRFIDLFAGIGGVRLGFQNNNGLCVFSSEFDKYAQDTYFRNHGEYPFGDITKISPELIPDHDVLLAGFPCQPFSHAGLKLGIDDTRGTLFHDIAKILEVKKPKFAVLENVKGLVSHEKGYTLQVVLKTLTDMGYSCNISKDLILNGDTKSIQNEAKKMVLKSVDFGVPQNRQRIYIVLWREGLLEKFEYPKPITEVTRVGDILEKKPDVKYTISDRLWAGHQRRKIENKKNGKGFGYGLVGPDSAYTNTISARYYKDGSEILIAQKNKNPRKVTPREAARLQGFPEDFDYSGSDTQAYKQFGNSVSVPVVAAIANEINKVLTEK
ncbi:MAG: DNA (cytosine-5)-methyltransferase 1 [Halieaceae bacterium]|jgi:DNA (cytosine-5)-methyltransferase 1